MEKVTYLAVFEPSDDGYGVHFPDLPGCISFGSTFDEAIRAAVDALGLHLYGMEKDGDQIPAPSKNPVIDPDTEPGYLVAPVTVFPGIVRNELDNKRLKTTIAIPAWLKHEADSRKINYSRLMEEALIEYMGLPTHRALYNSCHAKPSK